MSMYEVEALIEHTIRVIDKTDLSDQQKRNLIWNAFKIQNNFDCSFTHFRTMDILKKVKFVQSFERTSFPLYNTYPEFFNNLSEEDFVWIKKQPTEKWSADNSSIAYWDGESNCIFVDYGTAYYTRFPAEKIKEINP